ncbi:MAG TPA: glycosyltransferase family 39 protein [Terriglobales bacterium]|nr:glycosyltransferase family 39 protein [Terriglobales bacterium]
MLTTSPGLKNFGSLLRQNRTFFLLLTLAAIALRIVFLVKFRHITDDSLMYGTIAKNWMKFGVYGQTYGTGPEPTYIRLPGYPFFLILVWLVAGIEHYTAVLIAQLVIDVGTCFVITDLARRIASERAAKIAFALTALCPFFATYVAVALTETLAIFFAALAMDAVVAAFDEPSRKRWWIICGIALGCGILLRPDGGMLLIVVGSYSLVRVYRAVDAEKRRREFAGVVLAGVIALAPLVPWTIRNWVSIHRFQPLAPVNANNPDEFVALGFHKWVRTWIIDYASVEDIWFNMDGGDGNADLDDVPRRAFDNPDQLQRSIALFKQYDDNRNKITPEMDQDFERLANDRIHANPLRYYIELPFLRATDLWLRPRTEMLPVDVHWWRYWDDPYDFTKAAVLALINLFYVVAAAVAVIRGKIRYAGLFLFFFLFRTAFLSWMPNPEARYMLECYPALLAIAATAFTERVKVGTPMDSAASRTS